MLLQEEFESCTSSIAFRNSQEIKDPFENGNMSPVRQAGLNLLKGPEDFYLPCSIKKVWREKLHMGQLKRKFTLSSVSLPKMLRVKNNFTRKLQHKRVANTIKTMI